MLARAARGFSRLTFPRAMSTVAAATGRKPGVASLAVVRAQAAKEGLVVVDVRNNDPDIEFEKTNVEGALLPAGDNRPAAVNAVWNRAEATLDMSALEGVAKDAPIITH